MLPDVLSPWGGGGAEACQAVIGMQANPCKGHIKHYLSLGRCLEVCWLPVAKGKENVTKPGGIVSFIAVSLRQNGQCVKWHLDGKAGECSRKKQ